MKKTLLFAAALTIAAATAASAGTPARGTLTLGWSNCRVNGGGLSNVTAACTSNTGNGPLLVGGFIGNASSNLVDLNSAFLYVDIFSESAVLDPWWMFTDPPVVGCRPLNTVQLDMANNASATCDRSYWGEVGAPSSASRFFYPGPLGQNHGTLRFLVAVDAIVAGQTAQIGDGEESHVFGARIGRALSTGAGSCAGCLNKTCLYFAQGDFFQTSLDNFVVGEVGTNIPVPGQAYVSYQLGAGETQCPATAVRNATWGSIKSLYR